MEEKKNDSYGLFMIFLGMVVSIYVISSSENKKLKQELENCKNSK